MRCACSGAANSASRRVPANIVIRCNCIIRLHEGARRLRQRWVTTAERLQSGKQRLNAASARATTTATATAEATATDHHREKRKTAEKYGRTATAFSGGSVSDAGSA